MAFRRRPVSLDPDALAHVIAHARGAQHAEETPHAPTLRRCHWCGEWCARETGRRDCDGPCLATGSIYRKAA